ncbi:uncharacterized protein LOC116845959 isoform X2 [Odontomachus brunneus]|uniref:uncharacterized protein LOC116845959 isoform X2 n=1 Tax=Odontomachus brunneus TaxID=486640 RepID=UPI0013F29C8F|nr:uncharacterized protein LOC116845959 isoform X2 [Odontomachus brunneus]
MYTVPEMPDADTNCWVAATTTPRHLWGAKRTSEPFTGHTGYVPPGESSPLLLAWEAGPRRSRLSAPRCVVSRHFASTMWRNIYFWSGKACDDTEKTNERAQQCQHSPFELFKLFTVKTPGPSHCLSLFNDVRSEKMHAKNSCEIR